MDELDVQGMAIGPPPGYLSRGHTIALATPTQTHATLDATSASLVSHALQQGLQQQQQQQQQQAAAGSASAQSRSGLGNREADGGWCISWCKDRYWGEIIAAGCGTNGLIKVLLYVILLLYLNLFTIFFLDYTAKRTSFIYPSYSQLVTPRCSSLSWYQRILQRIINIINRTNRSTNCKPS